MAESAIIGEEVGYVPCFELAAALPADPTGAIVGSGVGYVPDGVAAADLPADPVDAIVGSGVGFVPKPCGCGCTPIFDSFQRTVAPNAFTPSWDAVPSTAYDWDTIQNFGGYDGGGQGVCGVDGTSGFATLGVPAVRSNISFPTTSEWTENIRTRLGPSIATFGGTGDWIMKFWVENLPGLGNDSTYIGWKPSLHFMDITIVPETGHIFVDGAFGHADPFTADINFGAWGGAPMWIRARVQAATEQGMVRVWLDGTPEPVTWDAVVGINTNEELAINNLGLTQRQPGAQPAWIDYGTTFHIGCLCIVETCADLDTFDGRTVSGSLGTASSGGAWTAMGGVIGGSTNVAGGLATLAPGGLASQKWRIDSPPDLWRTAAGFLMSTRFQVEKAIGFGADGSILDFFITPSTDSDSDVAFAQCLVNSSGSGSVRVRDNSFGDLAVAAITWAPGWWLLKWEHLPGSYSRVKVWPEGDAEPGWLATLDITGFIGPSNRDYFALLAQGGSTTLVSQIFDIDYIQFCPVGG